MTDAIKRAAEVYESAFSEWIRQVKSGETIETAPTFVARAILTAALSDRERMVRVLARHRDVGHGAHMCSCGWPGIGQGGTAVEHRSHQVDALVAHLLGGEGAEYSIRRGLAQSAAGDLVDLGDFTQYADECECGGVGSGCRCGKVG